MVYISIASLILLILFNFLPISRQITPCENNQNVILCKVDSFRIGASSWCCQADETCGKTHGKCETKSGIGPFAYLVIIVSIFIIGMFLYRCGLVCLSCRQTFDREDANNQATARTNICINPLDEESPPSYEQVMNADSPYRFENSR